MSRQNIQEVMQRRMQAAKATTGRMLAEKNNYDSVERVAFQPRESASRESASRESASRARQRSYEDEVVEEQKRNSKAGKEKQRQTTQPLVSSQVPAFSPIIAPSKEITAMKEPVVSKESAPVSVISSISSEHKEEEKHEKKGGKKKKEEVKYRQEEQEKDTYQSDDDGINLEDDEEDGPLVTSSSSEEEYEEERSSRKRSATPTPGSIPRNQMLKLLKSADVQSISADCVDTAIEIFGAIIEECIKPDGLLASSDVLQFVQYHFNNGEDDLPEDVMLPPAVFKDFAMVFFKEKKAGFRRDGIMLLHLFAEAMIRKITIAADMIASVSKRKIIKGEDFTVAYSIYSM